MEYQLLMEMHETIDKCIADGKLEDKYIVIFGSNEPAERIMEYLNQKNIKVHGLIDNNIKKDGTLLNGVKVTLPNKLLLPKKDNVIVFIASKYYSEMVVQLSSMGYDEKENVIKAVEYSSFSTFSLEQSEFDKRVDIVKKGKEVWDRLLETFPDVEKVFVCPLIVLGDAYVAMSYMNAYMKKNNISRFALVLVNRACFKVAYLFGFENNVFTIEREEMNDFIQFAVFSDMADDRILIMNHRHPYTCRIGEIGNYKDINFIDHYKYSLFELDEDERPERPYVHRNDTDSVSYVEKLFKDNNMIPNKTVILFPYAKTATKIEDSFWIRLTELLKSKGYCVCTNSGGDGEPAIKGTKELFFDIRYALETIEMAGYVIGLRSGLCDVISTAKAKKIILYPDRFYGPDSFYKFFSINRMQLCDDAKEIVLKDGLDEIINKIMEEV